MALMTPSKRIEIENALRASGGNYAVAAHQLNTDVKKLGNLVRNDPELLQLFGKANPPVPSSVQTISRTPEQPTKDTVALETVTKADEALAAVVAEEDKKFREGFSAFGFSNNEIEEAVALQKFMGRQFERSVQLVSGSVTATCLRLYNEIKRDIDRLATGDFQRNTPEDPNAEEKMLRKSIADMSKVLTDMGKFSMEGAATLAKVQLMKIKAKEAANGNASTKARFGAAPLQAKKHHGGHSHNQQRH